MTIEEVNDALAKGEVILIPSKELLGLLDSAASSGINVRWNISIWDEKAKIQPEEGGKW